MGNKSYYVASRSCIQINLAKVLTLASEKNSAVVITRHNAPEHVILPISMVNDDLAGQLNISNRAGKGTVIEEVMPVEKGTIENREPDYRMADLPEFVI